MVLKVGHRTHRERKELYIKALEDEVLRLKEIYSNISHDKDRLAEENRQLRALLSQNGLAGVGTVVSGGTGGTGANGGNGSTGMLDDSMSNPSIGYTSSASVTGSYAPASSSNTSAFTSPLSALTSGSANNHNHHNHHHHSRHHSGQGQPSSAGGSGVGAGSQPYRNPNLDYDQAGIDFVLTYDHPRTPRPHASPAPD